MKWKTLEENKYVGCLASIYIDLVREVSGVMLNAETLWNFCNELKKEMSYTHLRQLILAYNENEYAFGYPKEQLSDLNYKWIKMYYDRDSGEMLCSVVKPILDNVKKVIIENWSHTHAGIYVKIIREICSVNNNPSALKTFCDNLYDQLELNDANDFYIIANLGNIVISDIPKDIEDPIYDKENHYYHFYVDDNENANFVEIENMIG